VRNDRDPLCWRSGLVPLLCLCAQFCDNVRDTAQAGGSRLLWPRPPAVNADLLRQNGSW
jgi:hypothetical protein